MSQITRIKLDPERRRGFMKFELELTAARDAHLKKG